MMNLRTGSVLAAALLVGAAGFGTLGCSSDGGGGIGDVLSIDSITDQIVGDWDLASLGDRTAQQISDATGLDRLPTMSIGDDGGVSGFAGVNQFMSNLDLSSLASGNFDLGNAASTLMAGLPEASALEQEFLGALNQVTGFDASELANGVLSLLGENGQQLMSFIPAG